MVNNVSIIEINNKKVRKLEQHITNPSYTTKKQQVFIIGSKGIPAAYGGFETFVEKLTEYHKSDKIRYHVSHMGKDSFRYLYNEAKCFNIRVPNIGSAKAVYYDIAAIKSCIKYCKARPAIKRPIFYILACRIGPFVGHYKKKIEKLGGVLFVNPDGHEWKRKKWNILIGYYWKLSEKLMVKHADLLICDSKNIEIYIKKVYKKYYPNTKYIAYGSDMKPSMLADGDLYFTQWLKKNGLLPKEYYLVVGRFVPENNFETMIYEFMKSKTNKYCVIITTANDKFQKELEKKLNFRKDKRIKFVGAVYEQELLKKIRENAFGYLHGHEVGGTNPSLLEALGSTDLNLLLDVEFNREVGDDAALYWLKDCGNLSAKIDMVDEMKNESIQEFGVKAKKRITDIYRWEFIADEYLNVFLNSHNSYKSNN